MKTVVWFRQDLRTFDNPALVAATARGVVVPLFILDEEADSQRRLGDASRWWLHHSLAALQKQLGQLVLLKGTATALLPSFALLPQFETATGAKGHVRIADIQDFGSHQKKNPGALPGV